MTTVIKYQHKDILDDVEIEHVEPTPAERIQYLRSVERRTRMDAESKARLQRTLENLRSQI
jgi:hypothetical protein